MRKKIVEYVLNLDSGVIEINNYPIVKEDNVSPGKTTYYCKYKGDYDVEMNSTSLNDIRINKFFNQAFVTYVDDGTNTKENEKMAIKLFSELLDNRQKEIDEYYHKEIEMITNCRHSVINTFLYKKLDFIDEIKKQAVNCTEMLSKCDCVDYIKFLSNKGYKDKIMVDINNNGLVALHSVLDSLTDDCQVCRI